MTEANSISIKRSITVKAVVTPAWKEEAERELSTAISSSDQQLAQLEQEGQQIVDEVRSQSANPLDPRVQEQVGQVQQQVAAKTGLHNRSAVRIFSVGWDKLIAVLADLVQRPFINKTFIDVLASAISRIKY